MIKIFQSYLLKIYVKPKQFLIRERSYPKSISRNNSNETKYLDRK